MTSDQTASFFLGLAVVLLAARCFGSASSRLRQPPVVGEILAGVALGAVLGSFSAGATLLTGHNRGPLTAIADVGLAAFMFGVGMEIDLGELRRRGRAIPVAAGAVLLPLGGGGVLALVLAPGHAVGSRGVFVAFLAIAMSVTALPVLARLLVDSGLSQAVPGRVALGAASLGDAFAWICLAATVAVAGTGSTGSTGSRMWFLPLYVVALVVVARPLLRRMLAADISSGRSSRSTAATVAVLMAMSCATAEWLGLHFIFGAFLLGAVVPRAGGPAAVDSVKHEFGAAANLFMPVYFLLAGARVDVRSLDLGAVGVLAAVLATAIVTKLVGGYAGARFGGLSPRDAGTIAVLMNTRGLTEIVILDLGRQLGILDARLYAVMLIMALVTTAVTGPVLGVMRRRRADGSLAVPAGEDGSGTNRGRATLASPP